MEWEVSHKCGCWRNSGVKVIDWIITDWFWARTHEGLGEHEITEIKAWEKIKSRYLKATINRKDKNVKQPEIEQKGP